MLAVSGAIVAMGALAGLLWFFQHRAIPVFPNDEIGTLPESTLYVRRFRADEVPTFGGPKAASKYEEAVWSRMAEQLCGGTDLYDALMESRSSLGRRRVARALDERRVTTEALACGRAVAKDMGRGAYVVRFGLPKDDGISERDREREKREKEREKEKKAAFDPEKKEEEEQKERPKPPSTRYVVLYEAFVETLPQPPTDFIEWRDRGGLVSTRCMPSSERRDADCGSSSRASARLDGTSFWVSGFLRDVERFGREFSPRGLNDLDYKDEFAELGKRLKGYPVVQLGSWETFETSSVLWSAGAFDLQPGATTEPHEKKLEYGVYRSRSAWAMAERTVDGYEQLELYILAPSEDDAADLALDLKDWHKAVKENLDSSSDKASEKESTDDDLDIKKVERDYGKARKAIALRSVKTAEIEREGKLVIMTFYREPTDDERQAVDDMERDATERGESAAKIIRGLVEGERPDDDLLRDVGGRKLVEAVKDPEAPESSEKE